MQGQSLNTASVVLVAAVAVFLPLALRIVSSPLILLLLSPLLLLLLLLLFLVAYVIIGHLLDTRRRPARRIVTNAARPLAFSTPAAWQAVLTRAQWSFKPPQSLPPIYPESPVISATVNDILIMIVRDFVLTWYTDISSSPSFPTAVSSTLHSSLERFLARLATMDLSAILVKRVLPKITAHVEQFRESEVALRGAGLERRLTQSEELDMLLASRYAGKGGGKLHPAVDNLSSSFTKQAEEAHLKQLVEKVLPFILPEKEGNSKVFKLVVREIVSCSVLYPLMDMFADPDFWNRTIDQVAGAAIRQQRLISKVRNVLEAQLPRPQLRPATHRASPTDLITIRTDVRQFESFLRSIGRTSSLLDARRLKNDIVGEIRRTRLLLANHENEDWINGERTEDVVAFLDRLYTAKRKAEQRIVVLGGHDESRPSVSDASAEHRLILRDVLGNPTSLSYFMEFMDRHNRALLVQFWLTVESFKNPLEALHSGSSDDEDDVIKDPSSSATTREDISMIYDLYFSASTPQPALSTISPKHALVIRDFVTSETTPSPVMERKARRSVMLAQRQVENDMEQDFEDFQNSELWFRVVEDVNASRKATKESLPSASHVRISDAASSKDTLPEMQRGRHPQLATSRPSLIKRSESLPALNLPVTSSVLSLASDGSTQTPPTPGSEPTHVLPIRPSPSNLDVLMSPGPLSESRSSRAPLFDDPDDQTKQTHESRSTVEAIQAALTDIIALDNQQTDRRQGYSTSHEDLFDASPDLRDAEASSTREHEASLDADGGKGEDNAESQHEAFQLAGPGDLQLSYEIGRLSEKISNLQSQDAMLDTLIKKAELTGDTQELHLLQKSKSSLNRDFRELSFQKTQYEQQEVANRLIPDRTRLSIMNSAVGQEHGKAVVRYLVEVQQLAPDGSLATGWVVARRYNEFLNMHNRLRDKYASVRNLEFPGKRLVTALSGSFIDARRIALERYLQNLVIIKPVCESEELRAFLSRNSPFLVSEPEGTSKPPVFPGTDLVRTMYHSVAESIDDMFFGPSMLDVMIQRLTRQAAELAGIVGSAINDEDLVAQALRLSGKNATDEAMLQFSGDLKPLDGETSSSTFSAPICDLLLAVFELNKKNNWLRRQAIVIILQQVLGSTVERKIRETVTSFLDEPHIMNFITMFRDSLWPGGQLKSSSLPRSPEEKLHTRDEANRKLSSLIPDLAANMIGRSNARRGARRIFAVLQNRRLNQHIIYTVVDEIFSALFPEATTPTK
ncbi:PhoX domain-containing protein [Dentipellis sp. KUC8613]|nr:PhoX domain-containing protein [Dentipellis sp. KUC8613]